MPLKSGTAKELFEKDYEYYWSHLGRFTNLLIILNISLFFLTELVTRQNYYYTFYPLIFLGFVQIGLLTRWGFIIVSGIT